LSNYLFYWVFLLLLYEFSLWCDIVASDKASISYHIWEKLMADKYHQISLRETFSDCQDYFFGDAPSFFQFLEEHLALNLLIPSAFSNTFYQPWAANVPIPFRVPIS